MLCKLGFLRKDHDKLSFLASGSPHLLFAPSLSLSDQTLSPCNLAPHKGSIEHLQSDALRHLQAHLAGLA